MGTIWWRAGVWIAFIIGAGVALQSSGAPQARADHVGGSQVPGYDISWPQCPNSSFPTGPVAFAIIGINGGRPFTSNPCFMSQYNWARQSERNPAVYVNTDFPRPGRTEGNTGPFGTCEPNDDWCRGYNWGYHLAREAHERAIRLGVSPKMWWLDVETGNYWLTGYPHYNAQVLSGAIWYYREHGLSAGIYGTPYQWGLIAGPYAPGLPVWTAGAQGMQSAAARCTDPRYAFAGGQVMMVQYYDFGFDTNYECPHGHTQAGKVLPHSKTVPMVAN
ncbi:MAG: hypothetical protein ACRDHF_08420 [Tepidiformaceae bacterium]